MSRLTFELLHTDGAARRDRITIPHGTIETPVFMPAAGKRGSAPKAQQSISPGREPWVCGRFDRSAEGTAEDFAPKVCRTSRRCFDPKDKCFRHTGGVLVNSRWFASEASAPPDTTHHKPARRRCAGSIVNAGWRYVPAPLPGCGFGRAVFRWCARLRSRTTGYSPAHLRCALSPGCSKAPACADFRCKATKGPSFAPSGLGSGETSHPGLTPWANTLAAPSARGARSAGSGRQSA